MDCQLFERQMQRNIDGLLSVHEQADMLKHAGLCPECAALLRDMTALEYALKMGLRAVDAPAGFTASVMAALPEPYTKKLWGRGFSARQWLRYGSVAAAAVLLIAAGIFGLFNGGAGDVSLIDPVPGAVIAGNPDKDITVQPPLQVVDNKPDTTVAGEVIEPDDIDNLPEDDAVDPDITENAPDAINTDTKPQPPIVAGADDDADDGDEPYTANIELPKPAIDGNSPRGEGAFALTLLAAFNDGDAILPSFNSDGLVEFYITYKDVHQLWTQSLVAESLPEFKDKVKALPSLYTLSGSSDESAKTDYPCVSALSPDGRAKAINRGGEKPGLWLYEDLLSPDASLKEDTAKEISNMAGGKVLSWSPDNNKLLYTDAAGKLYVYYLHMPTVLILPLYEGAVTSAGWAGDSTRVLFAGKTEKDRHSGVYTIIIP